MTVHRSFSALLLATFAGTVLTASCRGVESFPEEAPVKPPRAAKPPTAPAPTPSADAILRDGFYRLRYPAGWRVERHGGGLIRADIVSPDGGSGVQVRLRDLGDADPGSFARRHLDRFAADMVGHWQGRLEPLGRDRVRVGGGELFEAAMIHHRPDGSAWLLKEYLWFADEGVVILQAGTPLASRTRVEPLLDGIAMSLQRVE